MPWLEVVTGLGGGAAVGVVIGTFVEPWKLRFASKARRRDQRAERCAAVVGAAREVIDALGEFRAIIDLENRYPASGSKRSREVFNNARKARGSLVAATAFVELSGPDDLSEAAKALRTMAADLLQTPTPGTDFDDRLRVLETRFEEFVAAGRRHVR